MVPENFSRENADERWMAEALVEARRALEKKEIPIGAVLVLGDNLLIGRGHNLRIESLDPTAHAEIVALRMAARAQSNYRLSGTTLYVTVEPCLMCFGALMEARVAKVVFGTREPRWGVTGSLYDLQNDPRFPHRIHVREGLFSEECRSLMTAFFETRR